MKKKPKPATAGEKIVISGLHARQFRWVNLNELHERSMQFAIEISTAKAIDLAIARAVKNERERCIKCLQVDGLFIPLTLLDGSKP